MINLDNVGSLFVHEYRQLNAMNNSSIQLGLIGIADRVQLKQQNHIYIMTKGLIAFIISSTLFYQSKGHYSSLINQLYVTFNHVKVLQVIITVRCEQRKY